MAPATSRAEDPSGNDPLWRDCVRTLRGWTPRDAEQAELRQLYLAHLDRQPHGWSRTCAGAHVTASSLICAPAEGQVLLTLHARLGRWLQTGGHLEPTDGSLRAAAAREATEESGLRNLTVAPAPLLLSRHEVPCGSVRPTFHHDVQYLVTVAAGVPAPVRTAESLDVAWFPADALPEVDDSVRALVAAAGTALGW